ncbi:hypothetical protein [Peribacillus simplex]|uniref:hypothetical protein n=1 Tax=Peribacillus simplex TaxID=1478 RepID=UPI0011A45463|nr:hypothetical protein [Peribacillus simplex]
MHDIYTDEDINLNDLRRRIGFGGRGHFGGFGRPFGFGFPFLGGLAAGALLAGPFYGGYGGYYGYDGYGYDGYGYGYPGYAPYPDSYLYYT